MKSVISKPQEKVASLDLDLPLQPVLELSQPIKLMGKESPGLILNEQNGNDLHIC